MTLVAQFSPGEPWVRLAIGVMAQVTGVVVVAALLAHVMARDAAARHGLWLGALAWVLLSPALAAVADRAGVSLVTVGLPRIAIPTPPAPAPTPGNQATQPVIFPPGDPGSVDGSIGQLEGTDHEGPIPGVADRTPPATRGEPVAVSVRGAGPWADVLGGVTMVWAAGVVVGLGRLVVGGWHVARLLRAARPLDARRHGEALARALEATGMPALPPVVTSRGAAGPFAAGVLRPRIVLPEGLAEALGSDALRDVLVHEAAHTLRGDPRVGLLQRLAGAFFWPHPLVHVLNAQLDRAREEVCDNFVLRRGDPCGYSRTLLTLTELCRPPGRRRLGLGLLPPRWSLADRVAGLLDPERVIMTRSTMRTRIAVLTTLVATGLVAASVRPRDAATADEPDPPAKSQGDEKPDGGKIALVDLKGVVVDERGRPVAGAVVRLPERATGSDAVKGSTAPDGSFALARGNNSLTTQRGLVAEVDGGKLVGLGRFDQPLMIREPFRIVVKPPRPLTVRVKDGAGRPVAGASVAAIDVAYQVAATTGADGIATLEVAADAEIRWVIGLKSGVGFDYFENYRAPLPATGPSPLPDEVGLTLDGAGAVRIRAVDSKDRPLAGVRLAPRLLQKPGKLQDSHVGNRFTVGGRPGDGASTARPGHLAVCSDTGDGPRADGPSSVALDHARHTGNIRGVTPHSRIRRR